MKPNQTLKNIFVRPRLDLLRSQLRQAPSRGVALLLVTFVVALASIVVTNLAYSTYLAARANAVIERSLFAEYLMKSASNVAGAFLLADPDFQTDGPQDIWAKFTKGQPIPLEMLGINEPHVSLTMELTSEKAKFPIKSILGSGQPSSSVQATNRDRLSRLCHILGFDADGEKETFGKFKGRHFNSQQVISNLIDYISSDTDSYNAPPFAPGIKGELPPQFFPGKIPSTIGQLKVIPGYTSLRMRKLQPLITLYNSTININFAPPVLLKALSASMGDSDIAAIVKAREAETGPIRDRAQLGNLVSMPVKNDLGNQAIDTFDSNSGTSANEAFFQVIAKVEFGFKNYYMRAIILRDSSAKEVSTREFQLF